MVEFVDLLCQCVFMQSICLICCRIGLVFVVNDADDVDGMQDPGVAMLRAFNYIADEVDNQMAFDAVLSVSALQTHFD